MSIGAFIDAIDENTHLKELQTEVRGHSDELHKLMGPLEL